MSKYYINEILINPLININPTVYMGPRSQNSYFASFSTSHEVNCMLNLFKTKPSGIREVPIFIYKWFCRRISHLFNLSISEGIFPDGLKEA